MNKHFFLTAGFAALLGAAVASAEPIPRGEWWTIEGGSIDGPGVPDYVNVTEYEYCTNAVGSEHADDIHRTSSEPITGLDIGYWSAAGEPVDLTLRIYSNPDDFGPVPPPLIAEYQYADLPIDGHTYVHLELPEPLDAPSDIWLGMKFDSNDIHAYYYDPPTLGISHDFVLVDFDGDGVLDWLESAEIAIDNFYLAVYTVPEPATLACMGLVMLVGAGRRSYQTV